MKFIDVLQNQDKKWIRKSWGDGPYIYIKEDNFYWKSGAPFNVNNEDTFADDWEVYEEPKEEPEPPLRVLRCTFQGDFRVSRLKLSTDEDITDQIFEALAPRIKELMKQ